MPRRAHACLSWFPCLGMLRVLSRTQNVKEFQTRGLKLWSFPSFSTSGRIIKSRPLLSKARATCLCFVFLSGASRISDPALFILQKTGQGIYPQPAMDSSSSHTQRKRPRPTQPLLLSTSLRRLVFVAAAAAAATAATTAHAFVVPSTRGCSNSAAVRRGRVAVSMGKGGGGGGGGGGKKKGSALQEVSREYVYVCECVLACAFIFILH